MAPSEGLPSTRGIEPANRETYSNGNEVGFGGMPAE